MGGEGFSSQEQKVQQAEHAWNEALVKLNSFDRSLKGKRNIVERSWTQNLRATEAWEAQALKGQLKVVENSIGRLKKEADANGLEIMMLWSKLLLAEVYLGSADT